MPATTSPFFGINYGWVLGEGAWGDPVNSNFKVLSFLGKGAVDSFVATLPISPSNGDSVVLTTDKQFYVRLDGTWLFIQPQNGQEVNETSTGKRWKYSGSWVEIATTTNILANLANTTDLTKGAYLLGRSVETFASVAQMKLSSPYAGKILRTVAYFDGWAAVVGTPRGGYEYIVMTSSQFNTMVGNVNGPSARGNGGFNSTEYVTHTLANGNIAFPLCDGDVPVTIAGARPSTISTASQHNPLNAAHAFAWAMKSASTMFNGGKSRGFTTVDYCGLLFYTNSTIQTVYDSDAVGSPDGGAGAQIEVCNGGLIASADWDSINNREMLRMTERTAVDWCNGMSVHHMVFDGALLADVGVAAERCITSSFYSNEVTRYKTAGVETRTACYNFIVRDSLIEYMPWPFVSTESNAYAGVSFLETDNVVTNCTIIANLNAIVCPQKTRIIGNHMYGNKYSLYSTKNLLVITGNYIEDPIWLKGGRDCTITANFFSESIKGAGIIMEFDGSGSGTGSSIIGNTRAQYNHVKTGDITLSATTGTITITSTANDFMTFANNTHVHEGAVIKAGGGIGYIRTVTSPTVCTVVVTKAFSGTSFTNANWSIEECLAAVFDSPSEQSPTGAHFVGNRPGRNITPDPAQHTATNDGRDFRQGYNYYDWTQGDGKGDFWLGSATKGLGIGTIVTGANQGLTSFWAKGDLEWLVFGGYAGGQYLRMTPGAIEPGGSGTFTAGSTSRPYSVTFSNELRYGTNIKLLSGSGTPEGVVTASVGSLYGRSNGGAVTTLYVKESGTGNTGWVAK